MAGTVAPLLYTMWLSVWGNSLIAAIALVIVFGILSFKSTSNISEGSVIILPVISGIVLDDDFPEWIKGVFFVAIGLIWALFILRITGNRS